ncbi:potassium-transporting ATPase subunit KdpC [Aeromicrobium sp. Root495]|uniref:potassium-transporting ATPase subunit KdpC n=1 Tax=Aeromicrobium sp. Root495 TaxID=1736550 RepID=UPI0010D2631E|nr:MAG: potassium-transporting ATPase subunit KdpC [Actinomycetales bacterium]
MIQQLSRQGVAALRLLAVMTVVLGVLYPASVWAVGQAFGGRPDGQLVKVDGRTVGSRLIGQDFSGSTWFHSRPSAGDWDGLASAPSNLGPSNPELLKAIEDRRAAVAAEEGVDPSDVPPDALTTSASGLDPYISPEYARIQVDRVARQNDLSRAVVARLVADHAQGRQLGFLGEPKVDVLDLNLAVRSAVEGAH